MKYSSKRFVAKILSLLFFSSIITPPTTLKPIVAGVAAVELAIIATEVVTAVGCALALYAQSQIRQQEGLPFNIPTVAGVPIANVPLKGKSDQEIITAITQQATDIIATKHNLNPTEKTKLLDSVKSQYPQHVQTLHQHRTTALKQAQINYQAIINQFQQANRSKSVQLTQSAIHNFFEANAKAHHPDNIANTQQVFRGIVHLFIDCNSGNLARRIEARIWLSHVSHCDPYVFGYAIKKAALNLQERYFDRNNDLVDLTYDLRLPETIKLIFKDPPYAPYAEKLLKELHEYVQKHNLDPGNAFEQMRLRDDAGGISLWKKLWHQDKNYEKTKVKKRFFLLRHGDRRKEIFENPNNHRLFAVASLAEHGDFGLASQLAQTNIDRTAIEFCRSKLCNEYGILEKYQHLPAWKDLSLHAKQNIARNRRLQDEMNETLQKEFLALTNDAILTAPSSEAEIGEIMPSDTPPSPQENEDPDKNKNSDDNKESESNKETDESKDTDSDEKYYIEDRCIQYEKLKDSLYTEEILSVTDATEHGLQRLKERGFTGSEISAILLTPDRIEVQADGIRVFIKKIGETLLGNARYNAIMQEPLFNKAVTGIKNLSEKSLNNLIKNYQ